MLLPSQVAKMRLNGGRHWTPSVGPIHMGAAALYPPAYSRIVSTPRVEGCNDTIGDCFPTACSNAVQTLLARSGSTDIIANSVPVAAYKGMTGYDSSNPASDQGTDPNVGFYWWAKNPIAGYRLKNVVVLNPQSEGDIRQAIATKGGVLLCVELALEQQNQIIWTPVGTAGSWGGHAVYCDSYDGDMYSLTSWGLQYYADRAYFNTPGFVVGVYDLNLEVA